jgi:uncharacterized membrane protein YdjX (TVP38/TMEM64 family)
MSARDVVHATGRSGTTAPAASRGVAESVTVAPIASEGSLGEIETVLVVGVGSVGSLPPHAASAIANARRAVDLGTDTLLRLTPTSFVERGYTHAEQVRTGPPAPALVHSVMERTTARPTSRRAAVIRLAALAGLLLGAAVVWSQLGPTDLESLRAFARRARATRDAGWAAPAFVLLYTMVGSLGLPITPLTLAAGVIFGAALGATLSWTGAVAGAAGGYLLSRRLGAGAVRVLAGKRARRIERLSESTGFLTLLRLQLIPVIPLGALNVTCGMAPVPLAKYVAAAAVGVIPGSVIYAYFADQVIAGAAGADSRSRAHIIVASSLLLALTFVPTVVGRVWGARREK